MTRERVRLVRTGQIGQRHGRLVLATRVHARPDLEVGMIEGVTSAFGIEFTEGGMFKTRQVQIEPGAFQASIDSHPVRPIMYEHEWGLAPIGRSIEETETETGLNMLGRLYVGNGPRGYERDLAQAVYESMLPDENGNAALDEFSIGFFVTEHTIEERATDEEPDAEPLYHYTGIDRREHSVVLAGANPGTQVISINSSGRVVDSGGLDLAPCTMPSEFTVGGRTYRPLGGEAALPPAAGPLPELLRVAGVAYRAIEVEAPGAGDSRSNAQTVEGEDGSLVDVSVPEGARDEAKHRHPAAFANLHQPAVRSWLRSRGE